MKKAMTKRANHRAATERAYETLIYNDTNFPIDLYNIKIPNQKIRIISMQEYSTLTGIEMRDLTQDGAFTEGYTVIEENKNRATIFYNDDIESKERKRFTIAHEIAHIVLKHQDHNEQNEQEADTFASQLLLPHCILERLIHLGKNVTPKYLNEKFGLSLSASKISLLHVGRKMEKSAKTEYEDIILQNSLQFISNEARGQRYYYADEDDEIESERKNWLYK
jgi:Zn-dependent peptidase ImmA (M78 family)